MVLGERQHLVDLGKLALDGLCRRILGAEPGRRFGHGLILHIDRARRILALFLWLVGLVDATQREGTRHLLEAA